MLDRVVAEAAERFGDATAYVTAAGSPVSYRQLHRWSDEAAVGLARRGVCEGQVVALVLPPAMEYLVAYLAAAKLGAITAGVNGRLTPAERGALVALVEPAAVLGTSELMPGDLPRGAEAVEVDVSPEAADARFLADLRAPAEAPPPLPPDPERAVAIVFTSGTTGLPKAAVFAGRQLGAVTTIDTGGQWGSGGSGLAGTSFAHLGPMTKLAGSLHRGGTTYLMDRWSAAEALRLVGDYHLDGLGGIPTQLALMLRDPTFDDADVSSVRAIVIGGGPATPSLIREARARFDAAVAVRYSCTEAAVGTGTRFDDPPEDAEESVGRAQAGVELAILDGDDRAVAAGEVGTVVLRSGAVMRGYWRDSAGTAAAFTSDGFVRTGDLGHLDERGRLHLVGRSKEMYVRGGYNVFPMEVEAVLAEHPDVADVAVAARSDPVMGEVGVAFVVPRGDAPPPDLAALRAFAAERLAHHKLPEQIEVILDLPRTPMDKLDRRALARLLEQT